MDIIKNDFNQMGNQPFIGRNNYSAGTVSLYLFSPRNMLDQYNRPYLYNFQMTDLFNQLNDLNDVSLTHAIQGSMLNNEVNRAIFPSAEGIDIHTSMMSDKWMFVLTIDIAPGTMPGNTYFPNRRQIISGYCVDEPINPFTLYSTAPVLNPGCIMQPTHETACQIQHNIAAVGDDGMLAVTMDDDSIPQTTAQLTNASLYVMNPGDLSKAIVESMDGQVAVTTPGSMCVSTFDNASGTAPSRLRSPRDHLRELTYSMDTAINQLGSETPTGTLYECKATGTMDRINSIIAHNLSSSYHHKRPKYAIGLSSLMAFNMQQLMTDYPNMNVFPVQQNRNVPWEVRPQSEQIPQNVLSSLIASTVSTLATNCGLMSVSFRYNSWMSADGSGVTNTLALNRGIWQIIGYSTLVGMDPVKDMASLNMFRNKLEQDLFPIIMTYCGHFDLTIRHDLTGEIIVDLQLLDFPKVSGLYETCNRFGGMVSPVVGASTHFNHNANEWRALLNNLPFVDNPRRF